MSDANIGSGRFDDLDIDLGYDGLSNDTAIGNVDFGTASISGSQDNYRSEYSGADAHIQRPTSLTEHAYTDNSYGANMRRSRIGDRERKVEEYYRAQDSSLYMWLIAIVPWILSAVNMALPGIESAVSRFQLGLIIFFLVCDGMTCKRYGVGGSFGWYVLGVVCPPAYLFVRAKRTQRSFIPAIISGIQYVISIIYVIFLFKIIGQLF